MFGKLKNVFGSSANKITGRLDVLQAVCAAGCRVAAADGDFTDKEVTAIQKAVKANETLRAAFQPKEINDVLNTMIARAEGGRTGRMELDREIREVADKGDHDINVLVLAGALDVAEAEGGIDDDETKVLEQIAGILGLKLSDYL